MIYLKDKPIGVDAVIQQYQQYLQDNLLDRWGMSTDTYVNYGRCYRNQKGNDYVPEMYTGQKEYQDLYFDDTLFTVSFFGCEEKSFPDGYQHLALTHIIFLVDLSKIKPTFNYRADEEARNDVYNVLTGFGGGDLKMTKEISGIDNVFKEYTGWNKLSKIKYRDIQNFHCFRFNFNLLYGSDPCDFPLK